MRVSYRQDTRNPAGGKAARGIPFFIFSFYYYLHMASTKKPLLHRVHDHFLPHKRNGYKPHIFRAASIALIIAGIVAIQGVYLAQIKFVLPDTDFLASVLPAALTILTNDDRIANGDAPLTHNALLAQAAQDAANDMAAKGYFSHVSPDGKDPWYWLSLVGYDYRYAGQNLAVNFTDSSAVESAWMASPSHHANIVKPQYTQIGIGVANGVYNGQETTFVVQYFGTPELALPEAQAQKSVVVTNALKKPSTKVATTTVVVKATTTAAVVKVLGAQAPAQMPVESSSRLKNFLTLVITSPTLTITCILSALAVIIAVLLIVAIVVKARVQYVEVIGGGLLLLLIVMGCIFFNTQTAPQVQILSQALSTL